MANPVPPGGPATINGIYYQMLKTLADVVSIKSTPIDQEHLLWVVEPSTGGDHQRSSARERVVYQAKARSTNKKWSLLEIIKLFPDFLRAPPADVTKFIFVTDGKVGDTSPIDALRDFLNNDMQGDELSYKSLYSSLKTLTPKLRGKAKSDPDASATFSRLVTVLAAAMTGPTYPDLTEDELRNRLIDVIQHFSIETISKTQLETEILNMFDSRGIVRERRQDHLDECVGRLYRLACSGNVVIQRLDILGDCLLPFDFWTDLCARSRRIAQQDLKLLGFEPGLDVRSSNPVAEILLVNGAAQNKTIKLLGKSGQGKTWALAKALNDLIQSPTSSVVMILEQPTCLADDLERASEKFVIKIQQADQTLLFEVLRRKVDELANRLSPEEPWLILFIDGITDPGYLKGSQAKNLKDYGIAVVVAISTLDQMERDSFEQIEVEDFTPKELLLLLKGQLGQAFHSPPLDVQDLIRRPILAKLYLDIARGEAEWLPTNEYELVEKHWRSFATGGWTAALQALELLAVQYLEDSSCPWTPKRLLDSGVSERAYQHFLASGLLVAIADGRTVRIWHDRVLEWAMAEGLVQQWLGSSKADHTNRNTILLQSLAAASLPAGGTHRYSHVTCDALWLLLSCVEPARPQTAEAPRLEAATAILKSKSILVKSMATLGVRIVPALEYWVSTLGTNPTDRKTASILGEAARQVANEATCSVALKAIQSDSLTRQIFGIEILCHQPYPPAAERLFELLIHAEHARKQRTSARKAGLSLVNYESELRTGLILSLATCPKATARSIIERAIKTRNSNLLLRVLPRLPDGEHLWREYRDPLLAAASETSFDILHAALIINYYRDRTDTRPWLQRHANTTAFAAGSVARLALWTCFAEVFPLPTKLAGELNVAELARFWPMRLYLDQSGEYNQFIKDTLNAIGYPEVISVIPHYLKGVEERQHIDIITGITRDLNSLKTIGDASQEFLPNRFHNPIKQIGADQLEQLWNNSSKLETALSEFLLCFISEANAAPQDAVDLLLKIGGQGIGSLADACLEANRDDSIELAFELLERSCSDAQASILNSVILNYPETNESIPYIPARSLVILVSHGYWDQAVDGIIRLGWKNLNDLEQVELTGVWPESAFAQALAVLEQQATPGALLALGLSGRKEAAHFAHMALRQPDNNGTHEAAWYSLLALDDSSPATLELTREALSSRNSSSEHLWELGTRLGLIQQPSSQLDGVLESRGMEQAAKSQVLNYLNYLNRIEAQHRKDPSDYQELVQVVWSNAFPRTTSIFTNARIEAIRTLAVLEPEDAFQACRDALRSLTRKEERLLLPRLMLTLDFNLALVELRKILIEEADLRLVVAVGEGLVGHGDAGTGTLLNWLQDNDELLREGAAVAARAFPWCSELEHQLRNALDDTHWPVRSHAEVSLWQILNHKEILALRRLLERQTTLPRKWAAMDAAIALGHPNISGVEPFWRSALIEGMPYLARKAADQRIKDLSNKLAKELKNRKREQTWLILRKNRA